MSGFDMNEFKKLKKSVVELSREYDTFLNRFITGEGMRCLGNTKELTPVDTSRLINSWTLSGPFKKGNTRYVAIHTNVYYASWVEDGHRIVNQYGTFGWQPGKHMARRALLATELKLPQRFDEAFADFCRGKGIGQ